MFGKWKTHEVFGISVEYRPVSYIDRGQLDMVIQTYLARDTHIALRGESKCGKSWLRQKNIPNAIVVQCRFGKTVTDLYVDALSQLQIRLDIERQESASLRGKVTAQGELGAKILAALRLGVEIEAADGETVKSQYVGHDVNDLRFVAEIIKKSGHRFVIEDFHYMSIGERKKFAFELKALWDYGLFVIIVGVWSQSNMLLFLNQDLTGRVHEIPISWSLADLENVLDKGGGALNLQFSPRFKERAIDLCYGNVGILQKLTLETLDHTGLTTGKWTSHGFDNLDALESAALFYADQLNPLYQQFARRVSGGIRNRKDSTGIYAHAMAVIMDAADDKLIDGLKIDEIFDIAHARQPRIQKGNLRTVLEKIESLQVDDDGRGLVIAYNDSTGDITAVDRQLLLYRQFCTVRWPWEDLIAEAEAGEQSAPADS
jgi:hypothetical protein